MPAASARRPIARGALARPTSVPHAHSKRDSASRLFESTSHGIRPTREAEHLARQVLLAKAELAQARAEIAVLNGADRGSTVIGAMPLARSAVLPAAILRFSALKPQHVVSVLEGPYDTLLEALRSGSRGCADRRLARGDSAATCWRSTCLTIRSPSSREWDIRWRPEPAGAGESAGPETLPVDCAATRIAIAPAIRAPVRSTPSASVAPIECNSLETARAILVSSDRLMLLSAQQVHAELVSGQLIALPHPLGRVMRAIGLTLRRDWHPTGTQRELIDALRQQARLIGVHAASRFGSPARRARGRRAVTGPFDG